MNPPKPFPILRLPFLAIEEVFKAMHPFEIINFSVITKRTKAVAMHMSFYPRYSIELYIKKVPEISIRGTTILCVYRVNSMHEGSEEKDGCLNRKVFKYSTDSIEKWKLFCIYVMEIFRKQTIDVLRMDMDAFVDQNISIIDFLKTNVKSVNECHVFQSEDENDVDEHAAYLLDNLKVNNEFSSFLHIKNVDFNGKIPKNLKELYFRNSQWIGYEKLLEIDSKHVSLRNNRISNKEWNLFLKKWMAMETHLNLELLDFNFKSLEEFRALVLHDIPHEVVDGGVKRTLKTYRDEKTARSGGIDIRRIDGKTATLFIFFTGFQMVVH